MTTDLARRAPFADVDLTGVQTLAKAMFESGVFPDVKSIAHAGIKVMAGAELNLGPVESMRSFHIIKGKVEFAAEFLAQRVRMHPRYDYEVLTLENDGCLLAFLRDGERLGVSSFTAEDRERAGLELETTKDGRTTPTPWKTFPRNMMFARAMSNGVAWFMPDIVAGAPGLIDVVRPYSVLPDDDPNDPTVIEVGAAAGGEGSEEGGGPSGAEPSSSDSAVEDVEGDGAGTPSSSTNRKATKAQLSKLVLLAHEHGWDDDERHRRAEVSSFNELTKAVASVLIEAWSADDPGAGSTEGGSEPASTSPDRDAELPSVPGPDDRDPNGPPSEEILAIAHRHIGTDGAIVVQARKWFPEVTNFDSITHLQMGRTVEHYLRKDKPEAVA